MTRSIWINTWKSMSSCVYVSFTHVHCLLFSTRLADVERKPLLHLPPFHMHMACLSSHIHPDPASNWTLTWPLLTYFFTRIDQCNTEETPSTTMINRLSCLMERVVSGQDVQVKLPDDKGWVWSWDTVLFSIHASGASMVLQVWKSSLHVWGQSISGKRLMTNVTLPYSTRR